MHPALLGLVTIIVGVGGCLAYFYFSNLFLDKVLFPAKGPNAGRNINRANQIRPWLFLFPAIFALGLYLGYPVFETLRLSFTDRSLDGAFVGFANYEQMMSEPKFWEAMRNNMLWLIVVPAASTAFGLLAAQLTDRISWGNIAKSLVFMPMAISFVGASVIFKLIYDTRPEDQEQIGILNAVWLQFEGGIGSFVFLKLLPVLILLAFAGMVGYVGWLILRPFVDKREAPGGPFMMLARAAAGVLAIGVLILLLLPYLILLPLSVLVAYVGWLVFRLVVNKDEVAGELLLMLVRAAAGVLALWMLFLSLRSVVNLFGADLPYGEPQTWLTLPFFNNFFLMVVLIWIQTGFAMVILSAALRGIPEETVEAAIVDGANPFQIFFKIKVPQIMPTIVVVWTTITLVVLKVFDIVFAMTNGQWETQVLANYMFDKLFRANDWGVGSASAIVIMILVSPILVWNVMQARKEMR